VKTRTMTKSLDYVFELGLPLPLCMCAALAASPTVDTLCAPAGQSSPEPPIQTPTRILAAAHKMESVTAASDGHLLSNWLLHIVMRQLKSRAAVQTTRCAAEQQCQHGGCGCWLREPPVHAQRL
jgi:hypothetical protein